MSKRQDILDYIKETLEGVSGMANVEVNRSIPVDIETVDFPSAFVYSGPVMRLINDNRSVIGYENWEWTILIEVWGKDQDMEALLALVHAALFAKEQMGGLAASSYIVGVDMMTIDVDRHMESMLIQYTVVYRHARGAP
jgi:hypothetical protein